jgi:isoprenylcysteine carboxyl methyltransferase (ICMT) family protein YpbQ
MSQKKKILQTSAAISADSNQSKVSADNSAFAFGRTNYKFMLIGIAFIAVGFLIMTMDKEEFGFGFLGITLGPLVVFAGFMIEIYAILKKKS